MSFSYFSIIPSLLTRHRHICYSSHPESAWLRECVSVFVEGEEKEKRVYTYIFKDGPS